MAKKKHYNNPMNDPRDPAWREPLNTREKFPPEGEISHPNIKEALYHSLEKNQIVADVGCGTGPFEYHRYLPKFIAFDMFKPETFQGFRKGYDEFRLGKLEKFPIENNSCDAVIMGYILEHVIDPVVFIEEANRVLRPGGWCYIAVPNYRSLEDRIFRLATRIAGSKRGPHIQKFTFQNMKRLVEIHSELRLQCWHALRASYLFMTHPVIRRFRSPFIKMLNMARYFGLDAFSNANYQFLFKKTESP